MNLTLSRLFSKKRGAQSDPLASADIAAALAESRLNLAAAQTRVSASAAARQSALDALDVPAMAAAEAEAAAASLAVEAAEKAVSTLVAAEAEALAREASEALTARRAETDRRVQVEGGKLLDTYDRLASQMASVLAAKSALDRDVRETNRALRESGRRAEDVPSIDERFRFEAGRQDPDRVEIVEELEEKVGGEWGRVVQLRRQSDGAMGSIYPTRTVPREVRRPGRKHRDTHLPSLGDISLPPGRIGSAHHWPAEQ